MTPTLLTLTLAAVLAADPASTKDKPREPNPFAPSLPLLTDAEEEKLDEIIDRFIRYDVGELRGADAKKARDDFEKLGPEAIPALIRGMNRAAAIDDSCPAVTIAKKLSRMLMVTEDTELLQFAQENIGAGVTRSRHMGVLRDLKTSVMLRKNALVRRGPLPPGTPKAVASMTVTELTEAAGSERGPRLKQVLTELGQRKGDDVIAALGTAAASYESDVQSLARDLLATNLGRQSADVIKGKLKDDRLEVRATAAQIIGTKGLTALGGDLIDLLGDDEARVRDAAHKALVQLNRGTDLGPAKDADEAGRADAMKKWRDWWAKRGR